MMKGEVWWADLGTTVGHEQSGRRPIVILRYTEGLVISIPLTTNIRRVKSEFNMILYPDTVNNLPTISVSMVSQIRSLDQRRLGNKIGVLSSDDIQGLDFMMKNMLALA
jgi:mRNA interferase MazF